MKIKLTEVQKAYLLGRNSTFGGNIGTHMYLELIFNGDLKRFEIAFNEVIKNQPMLRAKVSGMDYFEIIDSFKYEIKVQNCTEENFDKVRLDKRKELSHKFYSSTAFPFYTIEALTKNNDNFIILVSIDLIIADGLSIFQLFDQIKSIYLNSNKNMCDKTADLLYINEKYFMEKQGNRYKKDKAYWQEKIKTLPDPPILRLLENKIRNSKFNRKEYIFNEDELIKMEYICKEKGLSLNTVLLSFYGSTLQQWSEIKNFTINMTTFKRPIKKEYLEVIGDFTSTVLIDVNIDNDKTLSENITNVHRNVLNSLRHSAFEGIEVLREIAKQENKMNIMPYVFTSMLFDFDSFNDFVEVDYWISETPQVYVDCQIKKMNKTLHISWDYLEEAFEETHIKAVFNTYISYIQKFLIDSENVFINMKVNQEETIKKMYLEYNSKISIIKEPTKRIVDSFKFIKNEYQDSIAFADKENEIAFRTLDDKSNEIKYKIEEYKRNHNLKKIRIGIDGKKNIQRVIDMVATIKSGDSFCFISDECPKGRREQLEKVSKLNIYLKDGEIINLNESVASIPVDELYVIFTSGTTGTPKGISINEKAALNTIDDIICRFSLTNNDVLFNISELSFDLSIFDLIAPLLLGCKTVLCKSLNEFDNFKNYLNEITFWNSTPGLVQALITLTHENMNNLKYVLMSGDFISVTLVDRIKERLKNENLEIYSLGGATEASIWSIYYPLNCLSESKIPYGYPLSNQTLYVLDNNDKLLLPFVEGEIVIGGDGLANGYLDEEDNERVFYTHETLGYIYRTGDKGYYNDKGFINIVGRMKSELKVNGYRIDLIEIENSVNYIHHIKSSKILVKNNKKNKGQLLCFYTTNNNEALKNQYIINTLKNQLPQYMIPTSYIYLNELPLTENGKVSAPRLLELEEFKPNDDILTVDEIKMLELWKKILNEDIEINDVNSSDTFFDIGGDSIKLTELLQSLNTTFKVRMTIEELLSNFTLKELASYMCEKVSKDDANVIMHKNIIQLSSGEKDKNIVLIHAGSGEVAIYNQLVKLICPNYNIYAIKFGKDISKLSLKDINFSELANEYNEYLSDFDNIDLIGGWCIGGTLGFEIAKLNKCVKKVLLINSMAPVKIEKELYKLDLLSEINFVKDIFSSQVSDIKTTEELWEKVCYKLQQEHDSMAHLVNFVPKNLSRVIPLFGQNEPRELIYYINLFRSFERERFIYMSSTKIDKPILYIGAKDEVIPNYSDWNEYTTNTFNENHIKGDHTTIFNTENVKALCDAINEELQ